MRLKEPCVGGGFNIKYGLSHKDLARIFVLSYQDSNLDKQNQNLLCYHYTIRQSSCIQLCF